MTDTNVPGLEFTSTGLTVPSEPAVLAGVQADYNSAFGGNLNPSLETPQGQLASSTAAIISDANSIFAEFVNQVNPDTADGFMQDAIARIYFLNRNAGAPTSVQCVCVGQAGVPIPTGARAQDTSGNMYVCTQGGTIPAGGSITLSFANVVNGPIACPANTLTTIFTAVNGWESINNPAPGIVGTNVESRAAFEFRRSQSVALNAHGSLPSIYAAVFAVPNVLDVYAYENTTNNPITVGSTSYTLAPHSLYVAAVGGDPNAIAQAIWSKKDVGCDYNGNTSVIVTDTSGYSIPYPSYTVKFNVPTTLPIYFAVQIANSASLPSNIVSLVQNAVVNAFTGADGSTRVRIGSLLLASKFYGPVAAIGPEVSILSILLGTSAGGATLNSLQIGIDQAPTISAANVAVTLV